MQPTWHCCLERSLGRLAGDLAAQQHATRPRRPLAPQSTGQRIAQNIDVFDFELGVDGLTDIDGLDRGVRGGPDPDEVDPSTWDLEIPEP